MQEKIFQIGICVSQDRTVKVNSELLEDRFAVSVKMSTYLVAFVICDFRSISATTSTGVKVWH